MEDKTKMALLAVGVIVIAALAVFFVYGNKLSAEEPSAALSKIGGGASDALSKLDGDIANAAGELSKTGLEGPEARGVLTSLCASNKYALECATVSKEGKLLAIEPQKFRESEGTDISTQEHVIRMRTTKQPVMSSVFRTVEGFDAASIQHPVLANGEFNGSVSVLIKPQALLSDAVQPAVEGLPYEVWAMQPDGRIIYDPDSKEIGRMLFSDQMYALYPELISLGGRIANEASGNGSYEFLKEGLTVPVKKDAYWTTVGLHGAEWRVVLTYYPELQKSQTHA